MATFKSLRSMMGRGTVFSKPRPCSLAARSLSTRPLLQEWDDITLEGSSFYEDDPMMFRTYTVQSPQFKFPNKNNKLSLDQFVDKLPASLNLRQEILEKDPSAYDGKEDPVLALFRKMRLSRRDWAPFAHFDPSRAYTRNLIHTDQETFTLLLLCWNAGAESKIHDHPCDGCWLQVLQGEIQECRYEYPEEEQGDGMRLKCIADESFQEGQVAFINDSIGLHKVGNPCPSVPAVTLHLYHPPFQDCKVWDNSISSSASQACCAEHFSEYGQVLR